MTLEEAILYCEEVAEINQSIADNTDHNNWMDIAKCEKYADEHRQVAEWLRELKQYREQPEIIYCKDCRKHNKKVGFDENFHIVWKEDACPLASWRGKAQGHEFDYQFCAFAKRREDG